MWQKYLPLLFLLNNKRVQLVAASREQVHMQEILSFPEIDGEIGQGLNIFF